MLYACIFIKSKNDSLLQKYGILLELLSDRTQLVEING
jgi:hypothetical protein